MARDPNPSGLPSSPIVKTIYGPREFDVDRRVGTQHEGFRSVRRSLAIASAIVAALVVWVGVAGTMASASGMAAVMLAPLLMILAGTHLAVMVTRPKPPRARPDRS